MADTGGGSGLARRGWGGLPIWAWAVVGGVALGGVYVLFLRHRTSTTDTSATDTSQFPAYASPDPTTIVPTEPNGPGVSSQQLADLASAINTLSGKLSTPASGTGSGGTVTTTTPVRWVLTGKLKGTQAGHPVDFNYLVNTGYLSKTPKGGFVFTGKGGTQKGHPADYTYLESLGYIRKG